MDFMDVGQPDVTSLVFPEGLKSVGFNAFEGCSRLASVIDVEFIKNTISH